MNLALQNKTVFIAGASSGIGAAAARIFSEEGTDVVDPAASDEMIAILRQQYNEGIPARLPAGVSVAHKTGWNDRLYHDAAIVSPPNHAPYIVVIMTSGLSEKDEAPALVAALSAALYRQLIAP